MAEELNPGGSPREDDGLGAAHSIDPTDDLSHVIRALCAKRDARRSEIDPDDVLREIEMDHPDVLLRRGTALARKACRRLITGHLRAAAALDPEQEGPQIALPGLERLPSHVMYPVPARAEQGSSSRMKIVARHTRDATLAQHIACMALKQTNTQRCIAREAQHQRIIDLLQGSGCDSIREWEQRFGQSAA